MGACLLGFLILAVDGYEETGLVRLNLRMDNHSLTRMPYKASVVVGGILNPTSEANDSQGGTLALDCSCILPRCSYP
jgi:hypothetical protein